jgi:hypothetical protein
MYQAKDSPSLRSLRNRIAAHVMHGKHDARQTTAAARKAAGSALDTRLLAEIDGLTPGLDSAERQRRLHHLRKAYFSRLALKAAQIRKTAKKAPAASVARRHEVRDAE